MRAGFSLERGIGRKVDHGPSPRLDAKETTAMDDMDNGVRRTTVPTTPTEEAHKKGLTTGLIVGVIGGAIVGGIVGAALQYNAVTTNPNRVGAAPSPPTNRTYGTPEIRPETTPNTTN